VVQPRRKHARHAITQENVAGNPLLSTSQSNFGAHSLTLSPLLLLCSNAIIFPPSFHPLPYPPLS